ncbi:MAG: CDGSH iron-sulfur domain-containing protein [Tepidiformaceae bacterium]
MSEVSIQVRNNGPYLVKGGVVVMDADGNSFETKETVALCRCGHSNNKPFCDGGHSAADFQSSVKAGG